MRTHPTLGESAAGRPSRPRQDRAGTRKEIVKITDRAGRGGRLGGMTARHHPRRPVQAAFALPVGFAGMLLIGVVAAAGHGHVTATVVLALTSGLVAAVALVRRADGRAPAGGDRLVHRGRILPAALR